MKLLNEHDYEPVPGLPEALPAGEFIRWQGRPDGYDLAAQAFQLRKLAVYFGVLLLLRVVYQLRSGLPFEKALESTAGLAVLALIALLVLATLAWLMARSCVYTITNRRVVIRSGVAFSMTVNLPFSRVVSADHRQRRSGCGDLVLTLDEQSRASWIVLWPHLKTWHLGRARPMLRSLADAPEAARVLGEALHAHAGELPARRPPLRVRESEKAMHGTSGHPAH